MIIVDTRESVHAIPTALKRKPRRPGYRRRIFLDVKLNCPMYVDIPILYFKVGESSPHKTRMSKKLRRNYNGIFSKSLP
jgi:hypothetical protein